MHGGIGQSVCHSFLCFLAYGNHLIHAKLHVWPSLPPPGPCASCNLHWSFHSLISLALDSRNISISSSPVFGIGFPVFKSSVWSSRTRLSNCDGTCIATSSTMLSIEFVSEPMMTGESLECLGYLELFGLLGYYTLRHDVMRTNELGDSKRSAAITLRVRIA